MGTLYFFLSFVISFVLSFVISLVRIDTIFFLEQASAEGKRELATCHLRTDCGEETLDCVFLTMIYLDRIRVMNKQKTN
jgi:hypothetical protein